MPQTELIGNRKSVKKAKGKLGVLTGHHGFVPLHSYHSKVIPKGKRKNSMEK